MIVTASLSEILANALEDTVTGLFPDDELVNIACSAHHEVEVPYPLLCPLALTCFALQ